MRKKIIAVLILIVMLLSTILPTVNVVLAVEDERQKQEEQEKNTITGKEINQIKQFPENLQQENTQHEEEQAIVTENSKTIEKVQAKAIQEEDIPEIISGEYKYQEDIEGIKITAYTGTASNLVIPQTIDGKQVISIGSGAFQNNISIIKVEIPGTIKKIETRAFFNCSNLQEVILQEGIEELGSFSFGKTAIKNITIPKSLIKSEEDENWANLGYGGPFAKCENLTTAIIAEGTSEVTIGLFSECTSLKNVYLPQSIKKIKTKAFKNCSSLQQINFGTNITEIESSAFRKCTSLTKLDIPGNIKIIGNEAFSLCSNLQEVNLNEGVEELKAHAFSEIAIRNITIPKSVKESERNLDGSYTGEGGPFANCTNLEVATLEEGMTEIPEGLFAECSGLKEINMPQTVTKIRESAFRNCSSLQQINFGTNITEIESCAFRKCTSLTKLDIPGNIKIIGNEAFFNCSNLQEIILQEGIEELGSFSFGKTAIKNITIPKSLIKSNENGSWIVLGYGGPFANCTNLEVATLEEGMTEIPEGLFAECSGLKEINIPKTVTKIKAVAFRKCSSLNKIELQENIEEIEKNAFKDCKGLTTVKLPEKMQIIEESLFSGCENLSNVIMPQNLKEIKSNAFSGCKKLEELYLSENVTTISNSAFRDTNVKLYTDKYTNTMITIIDNGFDANIVNDNYQDSENKVIDKSMTSYKLSDATLANGFITAKIEYNIKSEEIDEIRDKNIVVKLPSGTDLHISGVKINSQTTENYKLNKEKLTIPIEEQSGEIVFCLNLREAKKIQTYAELTYKKSDRETYNELIDVIIDENSPITISAPQEVSTKTVQIIGIAPRGKEITITKEGQDVVKTTASSITGRYGAKIPIDTSEDGMPTNISVKTQGADGKEISANTTVIYSSGAPVVKSFKMHYQDHEEKTIELLDLKESIPTLYYNPRSSIPTFELEVENAEKIEKLYVVSIRDGVKKSIEAKYDEATNKYYASGYFDKNNIMVYVPGTISYEYVEKQEKVDTQYVDDTPIEETAMYRTVQNSLQDAKVDKVKEDEKEITDPKIEKMLKKASLEEKAYLASEYVIDFGNYVSSTKYKMYKFYKTEISDVDDPEFDLLNSYVESLDTFNKCRKYFSKDGKGEQFAFNVDISDPYSITTFLYDFSSNKLVTMTLKSTEVVALSEFADMLSFISPGLKIMSNYYKLDYDNQELVNKILNNPNLTPKERENALKCARSLDILNRGYFIFSTALTVLEKASFDPEAKMLLKFINTASGCLYSFVYDVCSSTIENINVVMDILEYINTKTQQIQILLKWLIDPSGYVYEAVPGNRLEGVKTTLYYKEKEDSTPKLWNAQEYEQENPLYTDKNGEYAWDVPEGLWQVKYEKKGYETVTTDWLPVPPPQTDVNVGLISRNAPKVEYINCYEDYVKIKFDKYMKVETLTTETINLKDKNNKNQTFYIEFVNLQIDNNGNQLVNEIELKPTNKLKKSDDYTITINGKAQSYANVPIQNTTQVLTVQEPQEITVDNENIMLNIGETKTLNITVNNLKEGKIKCISTNSQVVENANEIEIKNGKAKLNLKGNSNGSTLMILQLENTDKLKKVYINCGETQIKIIDVENENLTLNTDEIKNINAKLYPTTETQILKYQSNNKKVVTVDEKGNIKAVGIGEAVITITTVEGEIVKKVNIKVQQKQNYILGDVDNDGEITLQDYTKILSHVKGIKALSTEEQKRADIDGDGEITLQDYAKVLSHVKGIKLLF